LSILGKLERGIHGEDLPSHVYLSKTSLIYSNVKDRDLIFYLSYYHCLQTVKMLTKMEIKGTQLRYDLIDFKKVVTMTSLTLMEYTVSEPQTIH